MEKDHNNLLFADLFLGLWHTGRNINIENQVGKLAEIFSVIRDLYMLLYHSLTCQLYTLRSVCHTTAERRHTNHGIGIGGRTVSMPLPMVFSNLTSLMTSHGIGKLLTIVVEEVSPLEAYPPMAERIILLDQFASASLIIYMFCC